MHAAFRSLILGVLLIPGIAAAQNCLVMEPDANTAWTSGQLVTIRWNGGEIPADHLMKLRLRNEANTEIVFNITPQSQNTPNTGQYQWTVDAAIPPGRYIVRVNDTQGPVQCDSPPFTIRGGMTIADIPRTPPSPLPPRPDLWIYWNLPTGLQFNTTDATVFRVGVKNLGQAGSPACPFDYTITDGNGQSKSIRLQVPRIKAGGMELLQFQYQFTAGGTYVFTGMVDPKDEVREMDETNNRLSQTLAVADDIKPDLTLVDVSQFYNSDIGSTHKVWGKVKNIGKRRSPPVQLDIKCSPKVKTRTKTIRSLNPGDTEYFEFGFEYWTTGTKHGVLWVDMGDQVDEINEENNRLTFSFQVISGTVFD